MSVHEFIFKPGVWVGEGRVTFNASPEIIRFYTKWNIEKEKRNAITCQQHVELEGGESNVFNKMTFSEITPDAFLIELKSELLGTIKGKGVIDKKTIAWEFRDSSDVEGFEVYELQDNGDFMFHAEYTSGDHIRTIIDGRIWKKTLG